MMQPDEQGNSFLGELVSVWKTTALRATLEGICGYRYAIEFAGKQGLEMDALTSLNRRQLEQLVHGMAHEYLCYARQQEQELPLPSLAGGEGPPFQ
ncbi:hypothetical protein RvVAT039_pl09820 (plasmid) [Agrobacterium vitis]|nr:hypothetical protein RvVAT039_pl09820 [Agrobacterium vitis]